LKRHFKKKYGVNMSTFFIRKKMEYAQQLINEKNTSVSETAFMLGYKNVNDFITMFGKYAKV
ncbi:MAG TPA: AraC family transcriptional regulator, partial [Segetibacter sp.]|nr:AraC family transcriptional regulator [Segetibacter sp.]